MKKRSLEGGPRFIESVWQDVSFGVRVLRRNPGFTLTAGITLATYPLDPAGITRGPSNVRIRLEGRPPDEANAAPQVDPRAVSPGYFRALDIKLIRGRLFTDSDDDKAPRVAIVNDAAARNRWGAEDPIGKRFSFDNGTTWITVVGVVGNVKQYGLDKEPTQEIYGPIAQTPSLQSLVC